MGGVGFRDWVVSEPEMGGVRFRNGGRSVRFRDRWCRVQLGSAGTRNGGVGSRVCVGKGLLGPEVGWFWVQRLGGVWSRDWWCRL